MSQPLTTTAILALLRSMRSVLDVLIEHYQRLDEREEGDAYEDRC